VSNAFGGSSTSCPACNGTGRRSNSETVFRDVTKTKPSHYTQTAKSAASVKSNVPATSDGIQLSNEITSSTLPEDVKSRLIREIVEYEDSHSRCTQTFCRKIRRQLRP
jgi:hypothetical protein